MPSKYNSLGRLQHKVASSPVRPVISTATPTASNVPRSHPVPPSHTLKEARILDGPGRRISPAIVDDLRTPTENLYGLKSKADEIQPPKGIRSQAVNKDKAKKEANCPTPPSSLAMTVNQSHEQPSKQEYVDGPSVLNNNQPNELARDAWTVGVANQLKSVSNVLNENSRLPARGNREREVDRRYTQNNLHSGGRPQSIGRARNIISRVPQGHSAATTYKRQTTQPSNRPSRHTSDDRTGLDLYKDRADRPFILESGRKDNDNVPLGGQGSRQPVKPGGYQSEKGVSTSGQAGEHQPIRPSADITGQTGFQASNGREESQPGEITDTISGPHSAYFSELENMSKSGTSPENPVLHIASQSKNVDFHVRHAPNFTQEAISRILPLQSRAEPEPTTQGASPQIPTIQNELKPHDTIEEALSEGSTIQPRAESGDINQATAPSHPPIGNETEPGSAIQQATSSTPMLQTKPKPGDTTQNRASEPPAIESKSKLGSILEGPNHITPTKGFPFTPEAAPEVHDPSRRPTPPCEANRDAGADVGAVPDWMVKMTQKSSPFGEHPDAWSALTNLQSGQGPDNKERHRRKARPRQIWTTPEGQGVRKRTASPGVGNHDNRKKRQVAKSDSLPSRGYQTRSHTARKDA